LRDLFRQRRCPEALAFRGNKIGELPGQVIQIVKDVTEVREAAVGQKVGIVLEETPFTANREARSATSAR
jgi:hypothetical protein